VILDAPAGLRTAARFADWFFLTKRPAVVRLFGRRREGHDISCCYSTARAEARPTPKDKIQQQVNCSVVLYEFSSMAGERIVERLDKRIFVDEIAFPFCPGREDFFLLHLVQCFATVEGFLYYGGSFLQHFGEGTHVV